MDEDGLQEFVDMLRQTYAGFSDDERKELSKRLYIECGIKTDDLVLPAKPKRKE